ncbi:hypothetical protein LCGC14_0420820 [marine sediment metagenome]|uniref:Uncharacterized protein n=1 Tax=marine sediment metagenome TaxID=412755 RepID=A0A0F9W0A7_9ZZZZ
MKALLIEVDFTTGVRAGGINPRDKHLLCHGWQNLDSDPGLEIRLITDGRDIDKYRGKQGVTILDGKDEINVAIEANIPIKYSIQSEALMIESLKEAGGKLNQFAGKNMSEIAEEAHKQGLAGVVERKPELAK